MNKKSKELVWHWRGIIVSLVLIALSTIIIVLGSFNNTVYRFLETIRFYPQRCGNSDGAFAFYNVGNGDASCIYTNHDVGMIDVGSADKVGIVVNNIKQLKTNSLDFLVLSHPHDDHAGGTLQLFNEINVKRLFIYQYDQQDYDNFFLYKPIIQKATDCGTEIIYVTNGMNVSIGDITLNFFEYAVYNSTENESSVVVKATVGQVSCLYMGDADTLIENQFITKGYYLDCDILKVGHHGSKNSTSVEFLNEVTPDYSVVSVGYNSYGHPTQEVLSRLTDSGSKIYRTDSFEKVVFSVNKNEIDVRVY